jgi:hypothetical protein
MANDESDKVVRITLEDGMPVPSIDPIPIRKDKQKIKWCAEFEFTISIDGYTDVKYGGAGAGCEFSAKTGNFTAPVGTKYKYSITANGKTHDPEIDIKP